MNLIAKETEIGVIKFIIAVASLYLLHPLWIYRVSKLTVYERGFFIILEIFPREDKSYTGVFISKKNVNLSGLTTIIKLFVCNLKTKYMDLMSPNDNIYPQKLNFYNWMKNVLMQLWRSTILSSKKIVSDYWQN